MACRYQLRRSMLNPASAAAIDLINLDKEIVKFGRNPEQVQIVLHSNLCPNMISREHAHIRQIRNGDGSISFYLFDTSLNGTYVNDIRVNSSVLLHPGDTIKFGHINGAAMAPGQPAPQPYAEFAYIFEKMPRATSSQPHPASIAAHHVQAAAYDAAARRLAASPHSWPTNPYAPAAAAAYFAATGFSHPYLGPLPPGLLTPPPSATLSTATKGANESAPSSVSSFATGCGTYPSIIGGSTAAVGPPQQAHPFRPPSAMMAAAAAEAAAWFGVATAGQSTQTLSGYQPHQGASIAQLTLGGNLNTSTACFPNAMMSSTIAQHERQQLPQHCLQQEEPIPLKQPLTSVGPWSNRKPGETDTFGPLSMMHKRLDDFNRDFNQISTGYSFPVCGQRPQAYSTQAPSVSSSDPTISSNQTAVPTGLGTEKASGNYLETQSQTDAGSLRVGVFQHAHSETRRNVPLSPSDCEIMPPAPRQHDILPSANATGIQQSARSHIGADPLKPHLTADASTRDSVVVEAQSAVRSYADPPASSVMPTARVKLSSSSSSLQSAKEPTQPVAAAQLATSNPARTAIPSDLQKAECDSSVPSPPEDPVRRKSTGASSTATSGNACDDITIIEHRSSLNIDLLRLAADARSRCLTASGQDEVFDLEPIDSGSREISEASKKLAASSSSKTEMKSIPVADNIMDTDAPPVTVVNSPDADVSPSSPLQSQPLASGAQRARKKQRSTEVKRLYDDLQSSYLFTQRQKKPENEDTRSQSPHEARPMNDGKGKNFNGGSTASSSTSRSQSTESDKTDIPSKRRRARSVARPRRRRSTHSSAFSSCEDIEDENSSDSSAVPSRARRQKNQGQQRTKRAPPTKTLARTRASVKNGLGRAGRIVKLRGVSAGSSANGASTSSVDDEDEKTKKRKRGRRKLSGGNRKPASGQNPRRRKRQQSPVIMPPEDAWKYHDPSQSCAAGGNCIKPEGDNVDWVECDDCERWFHVNCVGCVFEEVKDEDTAFHCGCVTN